MKMKRCRGTDTPPPNDAAVPPARSALRANILLLATCQALLLANGVTLVAVTGLAGVALAPFAALATLPLTTHVVGSALVTLPASMYMNRHGRRAGFLLGGTLGIAGSLVCALAVWHTNFWLLCAGTAILGVYNAFGQYYRFAAAELASADLKSRAISWTLAGGIFGGVLGPETSKLTRNLLEPEFVGSYLALAGFAVVALLVVSRVTLPPVAGENERHAAGRRLAVIARQPAFLVAVTGAVVGFGVMNLIMNATPLAMHTAQHSYADTAEVLEWHVIGMFGPSFVTGSLIGRFGVLWVMGTGCAALFGCVAIAAADASLLHFWWALVLLGVGWNFLFIGGTTLLTETYNDGEKAKVQGANDFLVFLTTALSSALSGLVVTTTGWATVNLLALLLVVPCGGMIAWLAWRRTRKLALAG